eukprot:TRINITY_DN71008_c0_g1_i1.p1 TRINITY_DN71008_c0_g1~~TRINITY_DN71008_c0_g1_i1.p1  ORF type:complete len:503 (-),score=58.25 TRINITY_DN71008_c0_g1_i1:274-1782(-)
MQWMWYICETISATSAQSRHVKHNKELCNSVSLAPALYKVCCSRTVPTTIANLCYIPTTSCSTKMSDKPEHCVKFSTPDSGFLKHASDRKSTIKTTTDIARYHYHRSSFYRELYELQFDDLRKVPQRDNSSIWTHLSSIENVHFSFVMSQKDIVQSIKLTEVNSDLEKEARAKTYNIDPDKTHIKINDNEYFVDMNYPLHFNMEGNPHMWINFGVAVIGQTSLAALIAGIATKYGISAFSDAFGALEATIFGPIWTLASSVMKATFRFSMGFVRSMIGALTVDDALDAAITAAGDEWATALASLDRKAICFSVAGTVIMVAIILVIELVFHPSYQNVSVYNLTDYHIEFDFPYIDYGKYDNLPFSSLPPASEILSDGVSLGYNYHGVAFDFISDSELHGLRYTMRFKLKDPHNGSVLKTASALFEVPYFGDNSLYASLGEESNYNSYFKDNEGTKRETQFSTADDQHEIIVTYDYLRGKHENPSTGKDQYLYHSLVLIRNVV